MGTFKIEGVTHWSIPVNNLKESEEFYGGVLGLELLGRLSNGVMTCFNVGAHNILLCERQKPQDKTIVEERVHHSFNVSPEGFVAACKTFTKRKFPSSIGIPREGPFYRSGALYLRSERQPLGNSRFNLAQRHAGADFRRNCRIVMAESFRGHRHRIDYPVCRLDLSRGVVNSVESSLRHSGAGGIRISSVCSASEDGPAYAGMTDRFFT
jgi:hypothetical protein